MSIGNSGKGFKLRSLTLTVYGPSFLLVLGQGVILPALPGFAGNELGVSIVLVGVAVAARDFGLMAFDIPAGYLSAKIGLHKTMVAGMVLVIISGAAAGLSNEYWMLLLSRLAAGVGFALWSISRFTFMAVNVPSVKRGKASATFGGVGRCALILGPLIGGFSADLVGIRVPFFIQSGLAVGALAVFLATPKGSRGNNTTVPTHNVLAGIKHFAKANKRNLIPAATVALTLQFLRKVREIIPIWGTSIGLETGTIGTILSIASLVDFMMFPLSGIAMDKFGRRFGVAPAFLMLTAGMVILAFADSFWTLLAATVISGVGNGLTAGFLLTLSQDLASKDDPGSSIGAWRLITDAGGASSPPIITSIAQASSLFAAAMAGVAIGVLGLLTVIFAMKETLIKEPKEKPPP